jgi:hypothetical protein
MEEATDAKPPAKRARIDDGAEVITTTTSTTNSDDPSLPKTLAERHINITAASLHPQIAPIVTRLGKEHLILLCKRDQKRKAVQRLIDDDDVIPRSARFQFHLSAPKRTEALLEYTQLQEKAKAIITQCGLDLKKLIIQAAKLEITTMDGEIKTHLVRSIRLITQAFLIVNNDNTNCDNKVHQLASRYVEALSFNAKMDINEFCDVYKRAHSLDTFPIRIQREAADIDHSDSIILSQIAQANLAPNSSNHNDLETIKNAIESVLVTAWSKYTEQQQKNKVSLELKKLSATFFTEQVTEQTVLEVDQEPAADKIELKALIRQETKAETKSLEQKIDDLMKQIHALTNEKNSPQGGPTGAPNNQRNYYRPNPPSERWTPRNQQQKSDTSNTVTLGGDRTDNANRRTNRNDAQRNDSGNTATENQDRTSTSPRPQNTDNDTVDDNSSASRFGNRNTRTQNGPRRYDSRSYNSRSRPNRP